MKKTLVSVLVLNLLLLSSGCTINLDLGYNTDTKEEAKPAEGVTTAKISDYAKEAPKVDEAKTDAITPAKIDAEVPFTLTSGKPPYADPDPIVYEGRVTLKGWIENAPSYVPGTETDLFTVAEESMKSMPQDLLNKDNRYYKLTSITAEQMAELKKATKEAPVTIVVDKLTVVMEGVPDLNFVSIVDVK
jgi:hypothetical protein